VLTSRPGGFKAARPEIGSMLNLLRKSAARKRIAQALYDKLVVQARKPVFFTGLGVPDTVDGRFDLLTLHGWLVLARLRAAGLDSIAQDLTDIIFTGFDEALREQGAGDMGLGRRMKAMAGAYFGRLAAYDAAGGEDELAVALARNLWRGGPVDGRARALASYVRTAGQALESASLETGGLDFGPLPLI
jgi:cytochrome b pre-mRNA-processing protein 3